MNDNEICESLWKEFEPSIRKISRVKLRSCPDEVDDVVSQVFLALCEKVSKDGLPDKTKAWLYSVLNNIINQKYREVYKIKEKEQPISDNEYELPYTYNSIDEKIEEIYNDELKDKMQNLLKEDEFDIIRKIHFEKMKMKEIADLYNTTESAIKQKHYRICNKLRKIIKEPEKLI